jgi:hypothetical protein
MQKSPAGLTASPWLSSCTAGCTSCCTAGCTERRAASRRAHQSLKVSARERIALVPEKEAPKRQMHCTCACLPSELRVVLSGAAASGRVAGAPSKTTPSERYVGGKKNGFSSSGQKIRRASSSLKEKKGLSAEPRVVAGCPVGQVGMHCHSIS